MIDIAKKLIVELTNVGVEAYIWHEAKGGSVYIRFADNRMGSIRLADHNGRKKLKYKYNIRSDMKLKHKGWHKDDGIWRYFLPANDWKEMIQMLIDRKNSVSGWEKSKHTYCIPYYRMKKMGIKLGKLRK